MNIILENLANLTALPLTEYWCLCGKIQGDSGRFTGRGWLMLLSDSELPLLSVEIQNVHFIFLMWDVETVKSKVLCWSLEYVFVHDLSKSAPTPHPDFVGVPAGWQQRQRPNVPASRPSVKPVTASVPAFSALDESQSCSAQLPWHPRTRANQRARHTCTGSHTEISCNIVPNCSPKQVFYLRSESGDERPHWKHILVGHVLNLSVVSAWWADRKRAPGCGSELGVTCADMQILCDHTTLASGTSASGSSRGQM